MFSGKTRMFMRLGLFGLIGGLVFAAAAEVRPVPVDLELAFVVDQSGSIDQAETMLQRQGYARALTDPVVLRGITGGMLRSIAVAYIEFAAETCEQLSVPWTRIDGPGAAKAFAGRILALPIEYCPGGNAVGDALAFAAASIEANGFEGTRRVIDISGDGPNTLGRAIGPARDGIVAMGMTINGLVIDRPEMPELELYFRQAVTGGPGSFVIKAEDRRSFADAIMKKLILEIAGGTAPRRQAKATGRHDIDVPSAREAATFRRQR